MLHLLFDSPSQSDFLLMLRTLQPGDELLLLQDGVLAALRGSRWWAALESKSIPVFVLADDVFARGVGAQIPDGVAFVDYTDFVRMTVRHSKQISW
ncbi:sulfurtransferase complex subunit TusB [Enterobacteriaceae bacterium LUAb1]